MPVLLARRYQEAVAAVEASMRPGAPPAEGEMVDMVFRVQAAERRRG